MACDICGCNGPDPLSKLQECYQTKDVTDVCASCEKVLNDKLLKLRTVTHGILVEWIKRFMRERRSQQRGAEPNG